MCSTSFQGKLKDGDIMIETFTNGAYKYTLVSPALVLSRVKVNGQDLSKYLTDQSKVSWYDVSKNSGRDATNADGTMVLNIINQKYRLDLATRPLTQDELIDFYKEIGKSPKCTVEFYNPFTGKWKTIKCYRGDRGAQTLLPYLVNGKLIQIYNGVSQALVEL